MPRGKRARGDPAQEQQQEAGPSAPAPQGRQIRYSAPLVLPAPGVHMPPPDQRRRSRHILLQFFPGTPEHTLCHTLVDLPTIQHRSYDRAILEQLGRGAEFDAMVDARWARLLSCPWPQYDELTVEFLSTLRYDMRSFTSSSAVSFALGRTTFSMSVAEFGSLMELYHPEETASEDFLESIRGVSSTARDGYLTHAAMEAFWQTIAVPPHSDRRLASQIRDPMVRYLHRIVACSLFCRHSGREKVSYYDLFCLFCLLGRHPANLATTLLASLARARRGGRTAQLDMGPYVGFLAERLGVYDRFPRRVLTEGPPTAPYTLHDMQTSGMVSFDAPPRWVPHLEDPVLPDPPPMVPGPSTHRILHRGERPAREEPARQQRRTRLTVRYLYQRIDRIETIVERLAAASHVEVPDRLPEPRLSSDSESDEE